MGNDKKIIGIYHGNCNDGTAAAAVLLTKFPHAKLFPLEHGYSKEDLDPTFELITKDTTIYVLDRVLSTQEILKILENGAKIFILDHHIGAKDDIDKLVENNPNLVFIFDNNHSGSAIAWNYFYPKSPTPRVIELIEDADLWLGKYGVDSKILNRYLERFRDKPEEIIPLLKELPESILNEGRSVAEYEENLVSSLLEDNEPLAFTVGEYTIPACNSTFFKSVIGNIISKKHKSVVAVFNIKGKVVSLSLRSNEGQKPSALDIAKLLGGGGHERASGAALPLEDFKKMIS